MEFLTSDLFPQLKSSGLSPFVKQPSESQHLKSNVDKCVFEYRSDSITKVRNPRRSQTRVGVLLP